VQSGNWNTGSTWNTGTVPTAADNVIVTTNHTVTINSNAVCNNLQVGIGGVSILRIGNSTTSRTLDIGGTLTIRQNGQFTVNTAFAATHQILLNGNIANAGTFNLAPTATSVANITFDNPYANQAVNGVGLINRYNRITISKVDNTLRQVDINTTTFEAADGFLTLIQGTSE
jgi:hypothetical protein